MTDADIFYIIISEFSHKEKSSPIILFIINKNLEIDLNCTILPLDLTIDLRIESSKELLLDPKIVA